MEVKILGSVSPYCKNDKNCPGYLVKNNNNKILLDCGPGITRYMNLPDDLDNLTIIISHLHKDHYGDLLSLGYASYVFNNLGIINKRIKVYIPDDDYKRVVEKYKDDNGSEGFKITSKLLSDYAFLQDFGEEHFLEFIPYNEFTKLKIGDLLIDFSVNPHQIKTLSTRIVDKDKILVYSADTGFVGNCLVNFAHNADLLICESTFLRGQKRAGNNHLYAYEAGIIAKEANVKKLMLTHFFPEIEKSEYVNEAKDYFDRTEAVIENKVLKIGDLYE